MPAEVGVPGVRVDHVDLGGGRGHGQVDPEGLQREVGVGQLRERLERVRPLPLGAEAGDLDVSQAAQLAHQEVDMDAGPAVDIRGELSGQDSNAHAPTLG